MRATIVEVEGAKSEAEMAAIEILLLLLASLFITGHAFLGNNPGGLSIIDLYNQGWVGITCAGIPLYSSSFVCCVCLSYLSVES